LQPIKEEYLLTGSLELTNESYAIAKIAGIKMCQAYNKQYGTKFISVMPTNLYGPNDNYDLVSSHVFPALIRKFMDAVRHGYGKVEIWGTGQARREFLHADDLADACVFLMNNYEESDIINIGCGKDLAISELAHLIANRVGFEGEIVYDNSKPDGTFQKVLSVDKLTNMGWVPKIDLESGVSITCEGYKKEYLNN
jgi:GDP-L-fucose synthase